MKKYRALFVLSLILNLIVITYTTRLINGLGGIKYLSDKAQGIVSTDFEKEYRTKVNIHNGLSHTDSDVLFIGDSLTDYFEWADYLNNKDVKNRGIASDNIQGVIKRIDLLTASHPTKIFLMIGINNVLGDNSADSILTDYKLLLERIKGNSPTTKVYIQSLLPTYGRDVKINIMVKRINQILPQLAQDNDMKFVDLFDS